MSLKGADSLSASEQIANFYANQTSIKNLNPSEKIERIKHCLACIFEPYSIAGITDLESYKLLNPTKIAYGFHKVIEITSRAVKNSILPFLQLHPDVNQLDFTYSEIDSEEINNIKRGRGDLKVSIAYRKNCSLNNKLEGTNTIHYRVNPHYTVFPPEMMEKLCKAHISINPFSTEVLDFIRTCKATNNIFTSKSGIPSGTYITEWRWEINGFVSQKKRAPALPLGRWCEAGLGLVDLLPNGTLRPLKPGVTIALLAQQEKKTEKQLVQIVGDLHITRQFNQLVTATNKVKEAVVDILEANIGNSSNLQPVAESFLTKARNNPIDGGIHYEPIERKIIVTRKGMVKVLHPIYQANPHFSLLPLYFSYKTDDLIQLLTAFPQINQIFAVKSDIPSLRVKLSKSFPQIRVGETWESIQWVKNPGKAMQKIASNSTNSLKEAAKYLQLGQDYEEGNGVDLSYEEAAFHYKKAQGNREAEKRLERISYILPYLSRADEGNSKMQCHVGINFRKGCHGFPKSDAQAVKYLQMSVKKGYGLAMYHLAIMYKKGLGGLAQSEEQALQLLNDAASKGCIQAHYALGRLYETGSSLVPISYEKAFSAYAKAAERGPIEGKEKSKLYATSLFKEYIQKKADAGDSVAQFCVGFHCWLKRVKSSIPSKQEAIDYFKLAAENGNRAAQNTMGRLYETGEIVGVSTQKALEWYEKAANQGHAWALCNRAYFYITGRGGATVSYDKARLDYAKAVEKADPAIAEKIKFLGELLEEMQVKVEETEKERNDVGSH